MAGNYRHWKLETDRDNILWLSLDKEGASANVLSADVMAELDRILDELSAKTTTGAYHPLGKRLRIHRRRRRRGIHQAQGCR